MMGLVKKGMSILHFDETYFEQQRLREYPLMKILILNNYSM